MNPRARKRWTRRCCYTERQQTLTGGSPVHHIHRTRAGNPVTGVPVSQMSLEARAGCLYRKKGPHTSACRIHLHQHLLLFTSLSACGMTDPIKQWDALSQQIRSASYFRRCTYRPIYMSIYTRCHFTGPEIANNLMLFGSRFNDTLSTAQARRHQLRITGRLLCLLGKHFGGANHT